MGPRERPDESEQPPERSGDSGLRELDQREQGRDRRVQGQHRRRIIVVHDRRLSSVLLRRHGRTHHPPEYQPPSAGRAYKVSYNRPFDPRDHDPQSFVFNAEYPMVRFLEANGYDVKYWTGVDTDRFGSALVDKTPTRPKAFLSVGHDEYWSAGQRSSVEAARDAGVHLAFFSGNEMFWKTRWEPSITVAP